MKGVQCYELFGGIALKNHTFSFSLHQLFNAKVLLISLFSVIGLCCIEFLISIYYTNDFIITY